MTTRACGLSRAWRSLIASHSKPVAAAGRYGCHHGGMSSTPLAPAASGAIAAEAARRRTFAIISHPDAGKTTLTEKLLLYAGALGGAEAGSVKARSGRREATSD